MIPARRLPRDPFLPHLAEVLDPERMAAELQERISNGHGGTGGRNQVRVRDCRIERIKYKPGKNCLVTYRLDLHDRETGRRRDVLLCGRSYETGGSRSRFLKAQLRPLTSTDLWPPLFHLESLEMVMWAFPNERKLHSLPALTTPERLRQEILPAVVDAGWGPERKIAGLYQSLAHYTPEVSGTVRVKLDLVDRTRGASHSPVVFGKTYYDDQGRWTWRLMEQLWRSPARLAGELSVPRPILYQAGTRTLWQEGLEGKTLRDGFPGDDVGATLLAATARAVAALHQTAVNGVKRLDMRDLVRELVERCHLLAAAWPSCRAVLIETTDRLVAGADRIDTGARATLHGDLHPQNVLVDGERVHLIDLDSVAVGPPLRDLGSWAACLFCRALLRGDPTSSVEESMRVLVDRYRERVSWPVSDRAVSWFTATALIQERAFRCLTRLKDGRLEILDDLVHLADRISRAEQLTGSGDGW